MSEQYFQAQPQTTHDIRLLRFPFSGAEFQFETDAGVFSREKLDEGTELLLSTLLPRVSGRVMDLGCGWGAVGIIIAPLRPACRVVMTDINSRAAMLARKNAALNQVQAEVACGDGFEAVEGGFDWIALNPPIRAGKQVVYRLFEQSAERLNPGGCLAVVIRKQQGAQSARAFLDTLFGEVRPQGRKKGYHIYFCRRDKHAV